MIKRILKILGVIVLAVVVLAAGAVAWLFISANSRSAENLGKVGEEPKTQIVDGFSFRDLNKNGSLDVYEDSRAPLEARVDNLLQQMTLEEKAGTMFHAITVVSGTGKLAEAPEFGNIFSFVFPSNSELVVNKKMNHFNLLQIPDLKALVSWHNELQKLAARTRLGIPVTISSDPRHHFTTNPFVSFMSGQFSTWPEPLGFAAIGDSVLMQRFGDIARQEYRAAGIHVALHPMADLATEPRWPRINGTFGEDARLAARMTYAYIKGFQGDSLSATSVTCMTKHFSGGGPQKEGLDPHFQFQKGQVYPGNNFNYHLIPFEAAFRAGTAQIMPYYGVPMGQTSEDVGFAFNKEIITDLLRNSYHFEGVVCADWGVISDTESPIMSMKARAHGVMDLAPEERMRKAIEAGVDQFGGESIPEMLVELVKNGKVAEARLDISVRRILRDKFRLGLFDNPYVDIAQTQAIIGRADFVREGFDAQRRSVVVLKNGEPGKPRLPLANTAKVFVKGFDKKIVAEYATVVDKPELADVALLRLETPFEPMEGFLEGLFHHGDLDFKEPQKKEILELLNKVPTVVNLYLERAAVVPEIANHAAALLANFGASDRALLDVMFGKFAPEGKLPIELPASMEAVRNQKEDVPYDSKNPLYPFGFGLTIPVEKSSNR